jgi:uncharacterized protein YjiS (DUF1127 family)
MEGSSTIHQRRLQYHPGYALIEVLVGLIAAAWQAVSGWLAAFAAAQRQARARRELRNMSDHFLKDIGVDRNEIDSLFR